MTPNHELQRIFDWVDYTEPKIALLIKRLDSCEDGLQRVEREFNNHVKKL